MDVAVFARQTRIMIKTVLIVGSKEDEEAMFLEKALDQKGVRTLYFDSRLFPQETTISLQANPMASAVRLEGEAFRASEIEGVFWRTIFEVQSTTRNKVANKLSVRNTRNTLVGFLRSFPARWINHWEAFELHKTKSYCLQLVSQQGIVVPKSLTTNDAMEAQSFVQTLTHAIVKPAFGGALTELVGPEFFKKNALKKSLGTQPMMFQDYIQGTNIRTFVIGRAVYGVEIVSEDIDFRKDESAKMIRVEIPDFIEEQSRQIARTLKLDWTGIDWRKTPDGTYVFLEANFSPFFSQVQLETGFPLAEAIAGLLLGEG